MGRVKTFYSYSLGCRVNHAEREEIDAQLNVRGYIRTSLDPSFVIINTCAVTHHAERSVRQKIYQVNKKYPHTKIVITGCAATYWNKFRIAHPKKVVLVIPNSDKQFAVSILESMFAPHNKKPSIAPSENILDTYQSSRRLVVKIQDGCHRFCTYCIVPYLRGNPCSKSEDEILALITSQKSEPLEVILTAINTECYGMDTNTSLMHLIDRIIQETEIPRISCGSIHPWSITDNFIRWYKKKNSHERFVHFFHVPLQSCSDRVLKHMKREYSAPQILSKLDMIQSSNPYAFLATDIIVGFLEETDRDFEKTYEFLKLSPISRFHVFRFSAREQTAAYFMRKRMHEVSEKKKKERSQALRELSDQKFGLFKQKLVGYECRALVLSKKMGIYRECLLNNQIPALIKYNGTPSMLSVSVTEYINDKLLAREI